MTAVFFAFAIGLGLWAGATPTLMQQAGVGASELGLALTLHTGAYVGAMTTGGWLVRVIAPRRLILVTLPLHAIAFACLFGYDTPWALTAALTAAGATAGLLDIAMNTEATAVERELSRPVLTRMHAAGSAAFALGAIVGSLLASRAGPMWCALLVAAVVLPVMWEVARLGPRHPAPVPAHGHAGSARFGPTLPMLGAVLGLSIAAETTAAMWSSRFLAGKAIELAA